MPANISKSSPLVLLILDGWGWSKAPLGNAIIGQTPNLDAIKQQYPFALLQASGLAVGMDWGESGNSEIGHLTLGAGRSIPQYSFRINEAIKDGSFFTNQALINAFTHATNHNSAIHLAGLLTSGTVHAAFSHLVALMDFALKLKTQRPIFLHLFLDGRDSGLHEGLELVKKLQLEIPKSLNIKIATIMGRDYAMDRNNNWQLTEKAYNLLVEAKGERVKDIKEAIRSRYSSGENDPEVAPLVVENYAGVKEGDAIIFFNFREDSMRQLIRSFVEDTGEVWSFSRMLLANLHITTMTQYIEHPSVHVAFLPPEVKNSLTEVISNSGKNQLHIAESEKYAHVTYFFNGITSREFAGETDIFIKSEIPPKEAPEMKVAEITQKVLEEVDRNFYDFIVVNFANGDMLAHEGNLELAKIGVRKIDEMVGILQKKILEKGGVLAITSDHGNVESMTYRGSGELETKHNNNPVPFYLINTDFKKEKGDYDLQSEEKEVSGLLTDVAPTILELMKIQKPAEMTGQSLLSQFKSEKTGLH